MRTRQSGLKRRVGLRRLGGSATGNMNDCQSNAAQSIPICAAERNFLKTASACRRAHGTLSMNRPTSDPSQEGSRQSSASCPFPSSEGLGVGSWFQCAVIKPWRLSMNAHPVLLGSWPTLVGLTGGPVNPIVGSITPRGYPCYGTN